MFILTDNLKVLLHILDVIEVVMVLPWRKNVCIEYKASSVWPVPATKYVINDTLRFLT